MPISFPNQLQLNGMIEVPWTETIPGGSSFSSSSASFGYGGGNQSMMEMIVNWTDWANGTATQQLLGYPMRNPGSTPTLTRNIPAQHPFYTWLWATRIASARGQGRATKIDDPVFGSYTMFEKVRLQILFESVPYTILDDSDNQSQNSGVESARYCETNFEETAEFITRPTGQFLFGETAGIVTNGQALNAGLGVAQILVKESITLTWYQLPEVGLFTAKLPNGIPTKINNCVGHVNNGTFFGRGASTLLLLPPKFTPIIAPVKPAIFGLPTNSPPRLWNVTLTFKYFSPPTVDGVEANRGWNSLPASDNNWYAIKAASGSNPLYPTADFTQIFTMN